MASLPLMTGICFGVSAALTQFRGQGGFQIGVLGLGVSELPISRRAVRALRGPFKSYELHLHGQAFCRCQKTAMTS